jgi:hypothetical protein
MIQLEQVNRYSLLDIVCAIPANAMQRVDTNVSKERADAPPVNTNSRMSSRSRYVSTVCDDNGPHIC